MWLTELCLTAFWKWHIFGGSWLSLIRCALQWLHESHVNTVDGHSGLLLSFVRRPVVLVVRLNQESQKETQQCGETALPELFEPFLGLGVWPTQTLVQR